MQIEELNISSFMQCPVCLDALFPPILTCQSHHPICPDCFSRIANDKCPLCRQDLRNFRRCPFREMIFDVSVIPCRYRDEGCQVRELGPKIRKHQTTCPHRCSLEREIINISELLEDAAAMRYSGDGEDDGDSDQVWLWGRAFAVTAFVVGLAVGFVGVVQCVVR